MLYTRCYSNISVVFPLIFISIITGCGTYDPLTKEMDAAYKMPTRSNAEANKNVSTVIQKRFKVGTEVSEVLKELHEHEFKMIENRPDGWRTWPDGEMTSYANDIKRNIRIQKGQVNYLAKKNYDWGILNNKRAVISIESDGKNITSMKAAIYIDTL
jgi:hypothetical protein